ncbi:hypothetical protein CGZ69_04645 [Streptomyces peucetius subsp. caesius ATCC 27952]|nr:hypothetical protein CGZ69_04645 [Streptomyces peucetius subsp. caesius ATCC 27952]
MPVPSSSSSARCGTVRSAAGRTFSSGLLPRTAPMRISARTSGRRSGMRMSVSVSVSVSVSAGS